MRHRLLSTFFGILMGICIPLFLWVLLVEHLTLFILLPILPIIGIIVGFLFGVLGRIPSPKIWISLLIFTILIGATIGYADIRGKIMRFRREQITLNILNQYPNIGIIEQKYSKGNGMEIPPNVTVKIESNNSFEEIAKFYDNELTKNGWGREYTDWSSKLSWSKDSYQIFLSNKSQRSPTIEFRIDYLGYWMTNFSKI